MKHGIITLLLILVATRVRAEQVFITWEDRSGIPTSTNCLSGVPAQYQPDHQYNPGDLFYVAVNGVTTNYVVLVAWMSPHMPPADFNAVPQITLSTCDQEDGFEMYQSIDDQPFAVVGQVGRDVESMIVGNLSIGHTYCYKVLAFNTKGKSSFSNTDCITFEGFVPDETVEIAVTIEPIDAFADTFIDFGPVGVAPAPGYLADEGLIYDATRGYGWDQKMDSRNRNVNADPRLDTFVFLFKPAIANWRYDIPNGSYKISFAVGDPGFAQGPHHVEIEGQTVLDGQWTEVNKFVTVKDIPVTVTDGVLNIKVGTGNNNPMLSYIDIKQ